MELKRSNLKTYTLVVFGTLNIALFLLIQIDQVRNQNKYFLKPNSPYFGEFDQALRGQEILNFWERDLTGDNKAEFVLVTKKCSSCSGVLSVYQGQRRVFEKSTTSSNIVLGNGVSGIRITDQSGKAIYYAWQNNKFVQKEQLSN